MTSTVHLVQLFNRWSSECQPVRAFALEAAAHAFVARALEAAAAIEALEHDDAAQDAANDALESWSGIRACDAPDLRVFPVPFNV